MKIRNRIVFFLHWLASLLLVLALIFRSFVAEKLAPLGGKAEWIGIGAVAVYALLSLITLIMIFKGKGKRGNRDFITMDRADTGSVRISIPAVETMARPAVASVGGINSMKISVDGVDDAIVIGINAELMTGVHVPTVTMNMQRAIRQYIEMNCGVSVQSVSVNVSSVVNPADGKRGKRAIPAAPAFEPELMAEPAQVAEPKLETVAATEFESEESPATETPEETEQTDLAE
ncbi:MAG: alkaline shock response membrane anchor protein AmaP [Clostridia bacterium]|nr:alkaline shock response membrane anchor protein AmaP [Clostridia bacterium]